MILKDSHAVVQRKTRPVLEKLCKRIVEWRQEAHIQTRPDLEGLVEATTQLAKEGRMKPAFVVFVMAICEWWFRVRVPTTVGMRRAIEKHLRKPRQPFWWAHQNQQKPDLITRYVDCSLARIGEGQTSEHFWRFSLRDKPDELVKEFARPFLVASLRPLPGKRGGYPWLAPWVAATVIYGFLRKRYPKKQDSRPFEAASALASALLGRTVDASQFSRNRRKIEVVAPQLMRFFAQRIGNLTRVRQQTVESLLDREDLLSLFSLEDHGGLDLLLPREKPEMPAE